MKGSGDGKGAAEATDLVYGEPIRDVESVERTAEGLVLTEWKLVHSRDQAETQIETAVRQADLYRGGVLGGLELTTTRYVVLVSEDIFLPPMTRKTEQALYKVIMVRVNPGIPSKTARSAGAQRR